MVFFNALSVKIWFLLHIFFLRNQEFKIVLQTSSYQILTTPTKAYNLRSRFVPLCSPEHLNGADDGGEDIWSEQPPSDMTEMALTEELRQVQVR